jgi:hypothetical protein
MSSLRDYEKTKVNGQRVSQNKRSRFFDATFHRKLMEGCLNFDETDLMINAD